MNRIFFAYALCIGLGASANDWTGEWITDQGVMHLEQEGNNVQGKYAKAGLIRGKVENRKLTGEFENGNAKGSMLFELAAEGERFSGTWKVGRNSGSWRGWKGVGSDEDKKNADFSGPWLSSWGTLLLEQDGKQIKGTYGPRGWATVSGQVQGRRLELTWKRLRSSGKAWLEQTSDGERIFGRTEGENPTTWTGLRLKGFDLEPKVAPGQIAQGRMDNGMLYFLRMPDTWKPGDKPDVVVLLHGSNWTTRGMVQVTAKNWPEIARNFAIVGVQGDRWVKSSEPDDLRFNYFYVNWMGRSTYRGFPFTDRDSPYLVMNVIDGLKDRFQFQRIFVGGHSQGGYLTYLLHMHYPEKLAGTFPVAGGLVMQAEPDVFDDDELQAAQRATPMVVVHGKRDGVVRFSTSQYIQRRLLAHEFHRFKLLAPDRGHPYDFLPIGDAIDWLDVMSTNDQKRLLDFATQASEEKRWRDLGAGLVRAREIGASTEFAQLSTAYDHEAAQDAGNFEQKLDKAEGGDWFEDFLKWHDQFFAAESARPAISAYRKLQSTHDELAKPLMTEATKAFRAGQRNDGWAKYEQIVTKCFASRRYRTVKASLENRHR